MQKVEMDKTGTAIIRICIFFIILSLTAVALNILFQFLNKESLETIGGISTRTVVIDAGHGGEDGGASSADGVYEKELNLSVALMVGDMLKSSGYNVVYTRSDDTMLYKDKTKGSLKLQDLNSRLTTAQENKDCVFVSIHMNKFSQSKYSGLQVFYSKNTPDSKLLAQNIQSSIKNYLQKDNNRDIKQAESNIYILDRINTTGVLVECGFLSNPAECEKLCNEEYRRELSSVIYLSIVEFLENI